MSPPIERRVAAWLRANAGTRADAAAALGLTWRQVDNAVTRMYLAGRRFANLRDSRLGRRPTKREPRRAKPQPLDRCPSLTVVQAALRSRTLVEQAWSGVRA